MTEHIKALIGNREPTKEDWFVIADNWSVYSDYHLAAEKPKGVTCPLCWDWDTCAECLGEYPEHCPAECGDGTCYDHIEKRQIRAENYP